MINTKQFWLILGAGAPGNNALWGERLWQFQAKMGQDGKSSYFHSGQIFSQSVRCHGLEIWLLGT